MASMGSSRLDDLSLWTPHSRTAGDTASSSHASSSACGVPGCCVPPYNFYGYCLWRLSGSRSSFVRSFTDVVVDAECTLAVFLSRKAHCLPLCDKPADSQDREKRTHGEIQRCAIITRHSPLESAEVQGSYCLRWMTSTRCAKFSSRREEFSSLSWQR